MKTSKRAAAPSQPSRIARVRDVVAEAELAKQRARLYSRARVFIAVKYLGNADPTIEFEALESVLGELLIAADKEAQRAEQLLGQALLKKGGVVRGSRRRTGRHKGLET